MSATGFFEFGQFRLRPAVEGDRALLEQWIEADPFHRGEVRAGFFLERAPGVDAWALEDASGHVVFYFKTEVAARVHIQFGPAETTADRERNRDAMVDGLAWIEGQMAANGFREILFDSRNPVLIRTAEKRMGFVRSPDDLRRAIGAGRPQGSVESSGNNVARGATIGNGGYD